MNVPKRKRGEFHINEFFDFSVVQSEHKIRFGLSAIKNVGYALVEKNNRRKEKNGNYKSISDFLERVDPKVIKKKQWKT